MDLGINFNGDMSPLRVKKRAMIAEEAGFDYIWVGETTSFVHPFPVIANICHNTKGIKVGAGIISPQKNRCFHIKKGFETLGEVYGGRFVIGIAPGDKFGLLTACVVTREIIRKIEECTAELNKDGMPIFIGAAGPKLIELATAAADGILLNYVHPDFIKWAIKHFKKKVYTAAYGPSLVLPDRKNENYLRISAATVIAGGNRVFLEDFGLLDVSNEIRDVLKKRRYDSLEDYARILDKFTISGDIGEIKCRVEELEKLGVDQVVFSSPLSNNPESIKMYRKL